MFKLMWANTDIIFLLVIDDGLSCNFYEINFSNNIPLVHIVSFWCSWLYRKKNVFQTFVIAQVFGCHYDRAIPYWHMRVTSEKFKLTWKNTKLQ